MIPRPIAYRIWAACAGSQARRLRQLAGPDAARRAHRRGGAAGADSAADKAGSRLDQADSFDRLAGALSAWVGDGPRGGDLSAELIGLIAAYLYRHGPSVAELRERAGPLAPPASEPLRLIRYVLEMESR